MFGYSPAARAAALGTGALIARGVHNVQPSSGAGGAYATPSTPAGGEPGSGTPPASGVASPSDLLFPALSVSVRARLPSGDQPVTRLEEPAATATAPPRTWTSGSLSNAMMSSATEGLCELLRRNSDIPDDLVLVGIV